jgi:hypothetical protein
MEFTFEILRSTSSAHESPIHPAGRQVLACVGHHRATTVAQQQQRFAGHCVWLKTPIFQSRVAAVLACAPKVERVGYSSGVVASTSPATKETFWKKARGPLEKAVEWNLLKASPKLTRSHSTSTQHTCPPRSPRSTQKPGFRIRSPCRVNKSRLSAVLAPVPIRVKPSRG